MRSRPELHSRRWPLRAKRQRRMKRPGASHSWRLTSMPETAQLVANWTVILESGRTIPRRLLGLERFRNGRAPLDQALKTYEKVVSDHPLFAPATRKPALLYGRRATDDAKAYEQVTKARQLFPDDPEIAKTLGIMTYRRGLYPQAAVLLKDAATKLNDDSDLLVQLGEAYHQIKQWKECEAVLQRALKLNPSAGWLNEPNAHSWIALKRSVD